MPKSPISDRQRDLLERINAMERQVQAISTARDSVLAAPPLPPPPPPPPNPTLRSNLEIAAREIGQVAQNTLGMTPLGLHPLGMAINTGQTLGNLSMVGMNLVERERNRRRGTPRQRAERAYGQGIEARIARQSKQRKFK